MPNEGKMPEPTGGAPAGGAPAAGQGAAAERHYLTADEVAAQVQTMLARNGNDAQRTIATLINDNRRARDKLREARAQLDAAQKKTPAADAVVLTGEEKKAYEAFKALNLAPDKLKERVDRAAALEQEQATNVRNAALKETAKALGFNEQVFVDLVNDKKLHVEMRDGVELKDGKQVTIKLPYIRPATDEKAPLIAAKDYVTQNLAGYVPALTAKPVAGTNGAPAGAGSGTGFPAQSGGTSTASPTGADATRNGDGTPKPVPGSQKFMTPSERAAALNRSGT